MTRPHSFRQVDITRAIKAARAAGIANPKVTIDSRNGRITIVAGSPGDDQTLNEWDQLCNTPAKGDDEQ